MAYSAECSVDYSAANYGGNIVQICVKYSLDVMDRSLVAVMTSVWNYQHNRNYYDVILNYRVIDN